MTGIFYPYLACTAIWHELKYSLRSLERYFKEDFEVWIVGDLPDWIQNVNHIPHQNRAGRITCYQDTLIKLNLYLMDSRIPELFLRMHDDLCLIGNRTIEDFKITRFRNTYKEWQDPEYRTGDLDFQNCITRTLEAVHHYGLPGLNTETHCPELFEKDKMKTIINIYDPYNFNLLPSPLYFNHFPFPKSLKDNKTERALFHGKSDQFSYSTDELPGVLEGKYFLNYNDIGLDDKLINYLKQLFPDKSRYEK